MRGKEEGNTNLQVRAERQILQSAGLLWRPSRLGHPDWPKGHEMTPISCHTYVLCMYHTLKNQYPCFLRRFYRSGKSDTCPVEEAKSAMRGIK